MFVVSVRTTGAQSARIYPLTGAAAALSTDDSDLIVL